MLGKGCPHSCVENFWKFGSTKGRQCFGERESSAEYDAIEFIIKPDVFCRGSYQFRLEISCNNGSQLWEIPGDLGSGVWNGPHLERVRFQWDIMP